MQYGFFFDNTRCTGCRTCQLACKDYMNLDTDRTFRRIIDYEGGTWTAGAVGTYVQDAYVYHISVSCNHCSDPACAHVCPTGAMHKDGYGLVWPDATKCIGCGYCTMACPYHAPIIDQHTKKSSKCDGCRMRIEEGKHPICVESCPVRALDFLPMDELRTAHPDCVRSILPLADESFTHPNLLIKASAAAQRVFGDDDGHIANPEEI